MTWQEPVYSVGRITKIDEFGYEYDPDADVDASIPVEYEIPVEHLTEIANDPDKLYDYMQRVPNVYERNDTSALG